MAGRMDRGAVMGMEVEMEQKGSSTIVRMHVT